MKTFDSKTGEVNLDVNPPLGPDYTFWIKICNECDATAGWCLSGPDLPACLSPEEVCPSCGSHDLRLEDRVAFLARMKRRLWLI